VPGSPFLFKLKRPNNHIAGGGYFIKFSILPISIAWESFGSKNGAATREEFEKLIRPLMPDPTARDPEIGCTVLAEPFFWPDEIWIQDPVGWSGNIVRGRSYETSVQEGAALWSEVQSRIALHEAKAVAGVSEVKGGYGDAVLVKPRLGQGAFRVLVTDAYKRKCAITGERTLPVLEAAHILPFAKLGPHHVSNGLLLRSDFHKLFDLGYVTVDPDLRVRVSPRIKEEWFNGKAYYRLDGQPLATVPDQAEFLPKREYLEWHNKHAFQP
jgi:putative restriction endonuclease